MSDKRVVFLWSVIAYGSELLYMDPILAGFLREFPKTTLLNLETKSTVKQTGHPILVIAAQRKFFGSIAVFLSAMWHLWKASPELIILTEFDQMTIYGIFYRFFHKRTRLLLLVENDPSFLAFFYGVNRKSKLFQLFRKWVVSKVDFILTNSDKGGQYLREELKTEPDKVLVGIYSTSSIQDKSDIKPIILQPGESLKLLAVGRMVEGKGFHYLLQAFAELPADVLSRVHLTLVGDGPERPSLETFAKKQELTSNVSFAGNRPYGELDPYYREAHVFIFPTLGDYSGMVYFEALSAGLPIIGSIFAGSSSAAVEEGINGFIIDPQNTKTLADKITRFLNEPNLVEKFSKESIRKSADFTVEKAVDNLIKASYRCLGEKDPL
jgi:glycosyltransferase involved in cell wall biosynthesis